MLTTNWVVIAISALTGLAVVLTGAAIAILGSDRRAAALARQRSLADAPLPGEEPTRLGFITETAQRTGEMLARGKTSRTLREQLAAAGFHNPASASIYMGAKLLMFALGILAALLLAVPLELGFGSGALTAALVGGVLFFVPNLVVSLARDRRRKEIQRHLPNAIDLLDICVSAGLGLDQAWNSVAHEIRRVSPTLADEMELTSLEIGLGAPRPVAMRHLADRTGAQDVSSLVALLVQSERFGASIVEALRTFAQTMRETWSQRAEETAEKMAVKMLFPMVLFIFPPLLIIMVGPALLSLMQVFASS